MKIQNLTASVVKGKSVVLRVDYNVPQDKTGKVLEETRIIESLKTIEFLLKHGATRIHILSHLGRPEKDKDNQDLYSLKHILPNLEKLLGQKIEFRTTYTPGEGRIQLHENVRFYDGETKNDPEFIKKLLGLEADIFVNDAFSVSHRAHASVVGLCPYLPSYAGFLLQSEIDHLSPFLSEEKVPGLLVMVGGAKIETKVDVLKHFCKTADAVIIGGALANTFLAAKGYNIGQSFYEEEELGTAREVLEIASKNNVVLHFPVDVVVAKSLEDKNPLTVKSDAVLGDMKIFDIGKKTIQDYEKIMSQAKTIIWNGPFGCFEYDAFGKGTQAIAQKMSQLKGIQTILGGGDTLESLNKFKIDRSCFTHISTGGGAMLEFLEGKDLPGIESLMVSHLE